MYRRDRLLFLLLQIYLSFASIENLLGLGDGWRREREERRDERERERELIDRI